MKTIPFSPVKRKDRAVEDEAWIRSMLHRAAIGIMATANAGQPYIVARHFVFDETANAIYMHGALAGRTRTDIEANPRVCFSVNEIGRMLPAPTAFAMGGEYASVVVFGHASAVSDPVEATRALQMLIEKYFVYLEYGKDYRAVQPEELARTLVYRIDIEEWSGKRKQAAEDFPGAFWFGEQRKVV
ncbi:MAG: pyridoxamine 5'-phosphate oxidase family protein [Chloroflexi bacterium]|nr:pyridoxamine 5'-phosphate oxidase family protein [Chloroflexota bacterium]